MDQQLALDARPDVGSDQFACVKAYSGGSSP